MDIVESANDFQDWELLQSSSGSDSDLVNCPNFAESFSEIDSVGLVQVNYFSLDAQNRDGEDLDDDKSSESDNPSWVDPDSEENPKRYLDKDSGEIWSDSSSERSQDRKFVESDGRKGMDFSDNEKKEVKVEGIGVVLEGRGGKAEDLGIFCLDSSEMEVSSPKNGDVPENVDSEVSSVEKNERKKTESEGKNIDETGNKNTSELKKRGVVWWKMPVEFLKSCVSRMSPVWAVSVAAAMMGFVILGRRLYKMKRKTRGLEIKVALDDKRLHHQWKVFQVISRAACMNEAFSIVKRVPVIRPSLPAVGSTNTWPVMTLR
ncbi:hypothetical protein OROGR_032525 [Orobanche gracilis]